MAFVNPSEGRDPPILVRSHPLVLALIRSELKGRTLNSYRFVFVASRHFARSYFPLALEILPECWQLVRIKKD